MNIQNSKRLLKHVWKMGKSKKRYAPIMFVGASGVGKTAVVDQTGNEIREEFSIPGFETINLRLSQKEQGDLVGLPIEIEMVPCPYCIENGSDNFHQDFLHQKSKILQHIQNVHQDHFKAGKFPTYSEVMDIIRSKYSHLIEIRTANATPDQLPKKGNGILHLDELNRATKGTRDAVFELVLERKLGKYFLPPGWIVVSSLNPPSDQYIVHELDGAMVKRFCWILFCPEANEWLKYEQEAGLNPKVVRFIQEYPQMLGNDLVDYPYPLEPCPRSIETMGHLIENLPEELVYEVASGCVGADAATAYMSLQADKKRPVPAEKILNHYGSVEKTIKEYAKTKNNRADLLRVSVDDMLSIFDKMEDDLTFSSAKNLKLNKVIPVVKEFLKKQELKANERKIHVNRRSGRMQVTGLIVNDKVSYGRGRYRAHIRAALHNTKMKVLNDKELVPFDEMHFRGLASYIHSFNPEMASKINSEINIIAEGLSELRR